MGRRKGRRHSRRIVAGAGAGAVAVFGIAGTAQAADTLTVTKTDDTSDGTCGGDCSLREAIVAANSDVDADTIVFQSGLTGTISLTHADNELDLTEPVAINGPGANLLAVNGTPSNLDDQQIFFINQSLAGGQVTVSGLTLTGGEADHLNVPDDGRGGAIHNVDADLTISGCALTGNSTYLPYGVGGAIWSDGPLTIVGSTLSGNVAGYGSALETTNTTVIRNSTVYDNSGAAVGHAGDDQLVVRDSTVARNGFGIGHAGAGVSLLRNTIVADNTFRDVTAAFTAAFSLVENPGMATVTDLTPGSTLIGVDPALGPLQANGGPTLTKRPGEASPVIDRGDTAETADQRGFPRPVDIPFLASPALSGADAADIGAVELTLAEVPPPPAAASPSAVSVAPPRKKCKKKRKLRRGKCVEKKRKKKRRR